MFRLFHWLEDALKVSEWEAGRIISISTTIGESWAKKRHYCVTELIPYIFFRVIDLE